MKTYEYFFHCDVASAGGGEAVSVVAQLLVQRNSHGGDTAGSKEKSGTNVERRSRVTMGWYVPPASETLPRK